MAETWNPYLDEWRALHGTTERWWDRDRDCWNHPPPSSVEARVERGISRHSHREVLRAKYAFAVPSERALAAIVALDPIVEMGAGTGYWARCLQARGADVLAYDEMGDDWAEWFRPRRLDTTGRWPMVERGWSEEASVPLPQWDGIND